MRNFSSALFDNLFRLRKLLAGGCRQRSVIQPHRFRPGILLLEDRLTPADFHVNNFTVDDGVTNGTLRFELTQVSAALGGDRVVFDSAGTVTLSSVLGPLVINNPNLTILGLGTASNTVSGNNAIEVFDITGGTLSLSGLTISGGNASVGAGISNSGTLTIQNSTLSGNKATGAGTGGGIWNLGTLTVLYCNFSGNSAAVGSAIGNSSGTATVRNSTLTGNTATGPGGGIFNDGGGYLTLLGSTVASNSAGSGGGIFNNARLVMQNSTLSGNSATGNGGGIYQTSNGVLQVTNATVSNNQAASGGGLSSQLGTSLLINTIIAGNFQGATTTADDLAGSVDTANSANNLNGSGGSGGLTNGVHGNIVLTTGQTPGLGALANNGGPTQTMALLANSPALDAGQTVAGVTTIDQRGAQRGPAGLKSGTSVDIGAYEATSSYLVTVADDTSVIGSLRAAVGWANASSNANTANIATPAANTVRFDTAGVFATAQTITLTHGELLLSNTSVFETISAGPGAPLLTVSGNRASRVFDVARGVVALLQGLIITSGNGTGGAVSNLGGGILSEGILTIFQCVIANNTAISGGGIGIESGLAANSTSLTLDQSTISGNSAPVGGGIFASANTASSYVAVTLTQCTLSGNSATLGAGISISLAANNSSVAAILDESTLTGNTATASGGAVLVNNGSGSFANGSTSLTMNQSTLAGNSAALAGGGILVITNNDAAGATTSATITQSTITNNTAGSSGGGGIAVLGQNSTTISMLMVNTIVAGNNNSSTSAADDLQKLTTGDPYTFDTTGSKNNLLGVENSGNFTNNVNGNLIIGAANPLLATLGNYGGPLQTVALLPGSLALDAGDDSVTGSPDNFTTDQRGTGFSRKVGTHVDIGAFESSGFTFSASTGSGQSATVATAFASPLTVTILANNPLEPVNGGLITYTSPGSGAGATPASPMATITGGMVSFTPTANTVSGSYTITASASGVATPVIFSLTNTAGPADPSKSLVTVSNGTIATDNSSTITIQARDQFGNPLTVGGDAVTFGLGAGTSSGTLSGVTDNGNGTYSGLFLGGAPGTPATVTATINGNPVASILPTITVATNLLDVDGNGKADPLTDGILILRYMFKFTGSALTAGAIGAGATRTDAATIQSFLDGAKNTLLDPDGNGTAADPLTDGILILRYLFSFTGTTLTSGALGAGATKTTGAQVVSFLDPFNPNGGPLVVAIFTSVNSPTTPVMPFTVTFVFNRPVTGFGLTVIQVTNGSKTNFVSLPDGNTYTLDVTPSGPVTVTITVAANVVHDPAGNNNLIDTLSVVFK